MGVTGILEATSQLLAMNENFIPPTLNFTEPRPGCSLDYVPNVAREKKYDAFISANYAFGGNNAAVTISKWDAVVSVRQKNSERVVITGVSTVTALGLGIQKTLEQLRRSAVGIAPVTNFPLTGRTSRLAGQVAEFSEAQVDRRLDFSVLNPISKFAVSAGRLALENAGLKITPANGGDAGVVMGVCNGPSEMGHMDSVFTSENYAANIPSFSNITANSTAGWVSTQLYLKGVNASLSTGPHAGLQSLAYAFDALAEKRARVILAGAADEVYGQTFYNYDGMGFLFSGAEENDYRLRLESDKRKVLGEGAAMLVMETAESATARGGKILAEVLGYGMGMDAEGFLAANLGTNGLKHAVQLALSRAGIAPEQIGLLVWAPQGNRQDEKVLQGRRRSIWRTLFAYAARHHDVQHRLHRVRFHSRQSCRNAGCAGRGHRTLAAAHRLAGTGQSPAGRAAGIYPRAGQHGCRLQLCRRAAARMETMRRGVVITGLGILSCAGANLAEAREKFILGTCSLTPITNPRASRLRAKFAGQLSNFAADTNCPPELKIHDRHVHMALVAAREALGAAGVQPEKFGRRMGLIFSTCSGPMLLIEAHYERIIRGQPQLTAEELFAKRYYSGAQILAQTLGIGGICTTVVTACSASTAAIALAADLIHCGMLDFALAGGADSFSVSTLAGFDGLKATSDGKCAPFSKPPGLNLGEAAAFVFLESAESARQRGAQPHATVLGSGMSNDAHHCSAPEPGGRGLAEAMRRALADAGLLPEQISYINAHGTGTEANDKAECKAIRKVFGDRAATVPISSTKSMVGHCLGAAGAVEVIASIVCAEAGVLPPTANFTGPRDGCAVDCVPDAGRKWNDPKIFLSNNSAFGGHNTILALAASEISYFKFQISNSSLPDPIYITACGIVSAAGVGLDALANAWRNGQSGLRSIELPGIASLLAGRVDEALVEASDRRLNLRSMDRSSKWATVAARLAIRAAQFPEKPAALAELGLFLNLSAGPSWAESEFLTSFLGNDHQVAQLSAFPYIVPSSVAGNVCRALMLSGHNLTLSPGPGGGLLGLGPALAALRCGHLGAILCGAVDELSERILQDNLSAGLLSGENAIPPGEGATVLMLETARNSSLRGVKPLGEIRGFACAAGKRGLEGVVEDALQQAGIGRDRVGAVCYYGPQHLLARLHPTWPERVVQAGPAAGCLEGAQPLLDLALALKFPPVEATGKPVLAIVTCLREIHGAAVIMPFNTDTSFCGLTGKPNESVC